MIDRRPVYFAEPAWPAWSVPGLKIAACALKIALAHDLTKCDFADVRAIDPTALPTITFIQACKEYVSCGVNNIAEAC
ncbi:unnamed protein product [Didymodactylos carnosus]|uniref:Uncharacterized protein n=1 Tax=Didymodactylos carnosus TaxID=1234261 RepID=A0A815UE26_9BILA|nr:unnamed protein product [Didymodactylos carnosus]CAF4378187.1 unnamed protein product [Didymodactylos carnosus]